MERSDADLKRFLAPLREGKISLPEGYSLPETHEQHDTFSTVREGTHKGKKFEIQTTYRILIAGEPLRVHTSVLDDGTVHCHSFSQYSFRSAVDLARKLIDASLVEVPEDELSDADSEGDARRRGTGHGKRT